MATIHGSERWEAKDWLGVLLLLRTKSGRREWVTEGNIWKGPKLTSLGRRTLHRPVSCDMTSVATCCWMMMGN